MLNLSAARSNISENATPVNALYTLNIVYSCLNYEQWCGLDNTDALGRRCQQVCIFVCNYVGRTHQC